MIDLGTLRPDGIGSSNASGINARGHVAGSATSDSFFAHAYIWRNGTMTDLGTLGGDGSNAAGLNDDDAVVGGSGTGDGAFHAFYWQDGFMTDLGTLSGRSEAVAVNAGGQVIGTSTNAAGESHAVLWTH
jgi:probable HAF family extracellular repeat protein